jgi:hypothetical protein
MSYKPRGSTNKVGQSAGYLIRQKMGVGMPITRETRMGTRMDIAVVPLICEVGV